MEFETIETYMTFDGLGGIKEILPRTRNDAHKLIGRMHVDWRTLPQLNTH